MKHNLLFLLFILLLQLKATAQSTYYWSIDKKIPVDLSYQVVSVPFEGTSEPQSVTSKLGLRSTDVKEVSWTHNKINRIDFATTVRPPLFPKRRVNKLFLHWLLADRLSPFF